MDNMLWLRIGQQVEKITGDYRIKGEVRAAFTKANGDIRYVVEHQAEGGGSFLHIYSDKNLKGDEKHEKERREAIALWRIAEEAGVDHPNKYVLVHDSKLISVHNSYDEALTAGYAQFDDLSQGFLVSKTGKQEVVYARGF